MGGRASCRFAGQFRGAPGVSVSRRRTVDAGAGDQKDPRRADIRHLDRRLRASDAQAHLDRLGCARPDVGGLDAGISVQGRLRPRPGFHRDPRGLESRRAHGQADRVRRQPRVADQLRVSPGRRHRLAGAENTFPARHRRRWAGRSPRNVVRGFWHLRYARGDQQSALGAGWLGLWMPGLQRERLDECGQRGGTQLRQNRQRDFSVSSRRLGDRAGGVVQRQFMGHRLQLGGGTLLLEGQRAAYQPCGHVRAFSFPRQTGQHDRRQVHRGSSKGEPHFWGHAA